MKAQLNPSQQTLTLVKYLAYSPSEGASKLKSSPTDAHEIDTDQWHAESAIGSNSTLNRETSISNESPSSTLHDRHSHSRNIWLTHRVKGPRSQNHRVPMNKKSTPTMGRGVSSPTQIDSEQRGEHTKLMFQKYPSQQTFKYVKYFKGLLTE